VSKITQTSSQLSLSRDSRAKTADEYLDKIVEKIKALETEDWNSTEGGRQSKR
jgi:hypothetical protein